MDMDDHPPVRADMLTALAREDLDPQSIDELHARIAALEGEIERVRRHIARAQDRRASAEDLFRPR